MLYKIFCNRPKKPLAISPAFFFFMLDRISTNFAAHAKKIRLPADTNKRAKAIVDIATGENPQPEIDPIKAAAAALGRKGGLKGGKARAEKLSPRNVKRSLRKRQLRGGRK
jgi:hypothetical protein